MKPTHRLVFMGSDAFSLPSLRALLDSGPRLTIPVETVAVVTQPDRPVGRGRRLASGPVKALAEQHGLPVLQPERLRHRDSVEELAGFRPDLIVVAAYGQILSSSVLELPAHGCLNLHPSLLPRHRGASPVAGTILAGDSLTGTTVMVMAPAMDAGPILAQATVEVYQTDTTGSLESRLADLSASLLVETLPRWLAGRITPEPQNEENATYSGRLSKEDGRLDWQCGAEQLARCVRAFNPWPIAYSSWQGQTIRILYAEAISGDAETGRVIALEGDKLLIGTGDGLLAVSQIQIPGGRRLGSSEFVAGHRSLVGSRLE